MWKLFGTLVILTIITLKLWIYWSSNLELNKTIIIQKIETQFIKIEKNPMISPSNAFCRTKPFLIMIVTSYVGNVELRSAHRRVLPLELLDSMNATRVFLLAKIPSHEKFINQAAIEVESETYGDILQGWFLENYRNLTFKNLMGLQWVSTKCSSASYILKADDDTVFNLPRTLTLLTSKKIKADFLMGNIRNNTKPQRNKHDKWYVTREEYANNAYPIYLSGCFYITTPKVGAMLTGEAKYHPYFWIEDIFITGILTKALNIKLIQLPNGSVWLNHRNELTVCCLGDMIMINSTLQTMFMCDSKLWLNGGRHNFLEFNDVVRVCSRLKHCAATNREQYFYKVCLGTETYESLMNLTLTHTVPTFSKPSATLVADPMVIPIFT